MSPTFSSLSVRNYRIYASGLAGLQRRYLDGPRRPGLAGPHPADRPLVERPGHRHGTPVPAVPHPGAGDRDDRRPVQQAAHPADHPVVPRPVRAGPRGAHPHRPRRAVARLPHRLPPGRRDRRRQPGPPVLRLRDGPQGPAEQRRGPQQRLVQRGPLIGPGVAGLVIAASAPAWAAAAQHPLLRLRPASPLACGPRDLAPAPARPRQGADPAGSAPTYGADPTSCW